MKKLTVFLIAVLILCIPCFTAFAASPEKQDAVIKTTVPATHKVTFIIHGNGSISDGENDSVGKFKYYNRQSVNRYEMSAEEGNRLAKVIYDSENVTAQATNSIFTAPPLIADTVLEVYFEKIETSPESQPSVEPSVPDTSETSRVSTCDTTNLIYGVSLMLISIFSIALCTVSKNRHSQK